MPTDIILQQTPEEAELLRQREELACVRVTLAERELEVADLRTHLKTFEGRYLRQVGVLYAELDDWEARIAEREVALYDSETARERAREARQRADDTHEAAYGEAYEAEEFEPSPDLKRLFRDVAKRIHPDFAKDAAEQDHCTRMMARANKAYGRGDAEALQRILDDFHETAESVSGEDSIAELLRIGRQIQHALRDIAAIEQEMRELPTSEIAQFQHDAEAAEREGRDLLAELAASLREKIADAKRRYEFIDRQMFAHGR
jgi:phage terminase Nu1 subunit (DNA packaging protein)